MIPPHRRVLGRAYITALGAVMLAAFALPAAPAHAATGAGTLVDVLFGNLTGTSLPYTGTYSCQGPGSATLTVTATEPTLTGTATATHTQTLSCPATAAPLSGTLTAPWQNGGTIAWDVELHDTAAAMDAFQQGTDDLAAKQDDSVSVDQARLNADNTVTLTGIYECDTPGPDTIVETVTRQTPASLPTGTTTGQTVVPCPTTGPTTYTLTTGPLAPAATSASTPRGTLLKAAGGGAAAGLGAALLYKAFKKKN